MLSSAEEVRGKKNDMLMRGGKTAQTSELYQQSRDTEADEIFRAVSYPTNRCFFIIVCILIKNII